MSLALAVILQCPISSDDALRSFVRSCIERGVGLIAVTGPESERIHDRVDDLLIEADAFLLTTWHDGEPIEEVQDVIRSIQDEDETVIEVAMV
jgi:hypothetical protein